MSQQASPSTQKPLRIAVLGVGLMGSGIATLLADAGHKVTGWDTRPQALEELEALSAADSPVSTTPILAVAVTDADVIVEAIAEDLTAKHELYASISRLNPTAIVASNTSSLPSEELAKGLSNPRRFAIAHFFNHPRVVPLVEIVPAEGVTAPETLETLRKLMEHAGKMPVVLSRAVPGFIANRLQAALYREAFALAADGVASMEDIDLVVRAGLGSRWAAAGPGAITDRGGLDVWKAVCSGLFPRLSNDSGVPKAITDAVARGDLGVKTGKGIYVHDDKAADEAVGERIVKHFQLEFADRR